MSTIDFAEYTTADLKRRLSNTRHLLSVELAERADEDAARFHGNDLGSPAYHHNEARIDALNMKMEETAAEIKRRGE